MDPNYLAMAYVFIKDWPALKIICQRALLLARQSRDEILTCTSLWLSAWGEAWLQQHTDAAQSLEQAQAILGVHDSIIIYDWLLVASADIALQSGRTTLAIALSQRAIEVARRMGAIFGEGLAHKTLASALVAQPLPDYDEAEAHLSAAVERFAQGEAWLELSFTRLLWAKLQIANKAWDSAYLSIERARDIIELADLPQWNSRVRQLLEQVQHRR